MLSGYANHDLLEGFFAGVHAVLVRAKLAPADVNGVVVHATTVVTNALIERKGPRTAMLVTRGFRDILAIRNEHRYEMYDPQIEFPQPLVPPELTFGVTDWRIRFRREMNENDSEASARAVDSLTNFETVKAFAAEGRETRRFEEALGAYGRAAVRANNSLSLLNAIQGVVMALGLGLMAALAANAMLEGRLGPGDIMAATLVMLNLYAPLNILGFAYREIKQGAADMEAMFALLDEKPQVADAPGAIDLPAGPGEVRFENVSFAHDGRAAGLDAVTFTAPAGLRTAIVGPSGAGKSTILRLVFRFYDPEQGRISVDGHDLKALKQESLRAALGLVPQDVVLFNDTLRFNVTYGRPDATDAEIAEALRRAQLTDFVTRLPQGLETKVGERGLKLSGGQRQRVGIARVILKDPRILILDEATSALDSRTEGEIQSALEEASRGRTTIVVAHRLSTIADADQIVVLDDGKVAERGTHADLVARGGIYADLWRRQAEEPELMADPALEARA